MKKLIIAIAALLVLSAPSGATSFAMKGNMTYTFIDPDPAWFDHLRPPQLEINIGDAKYIGAICATLLGYPEVACVQFDAVNCRVYVDRDFFPQEAIRAAILHEVAHCHGWGADHPTGSPQGFRGDW
tara:strand:+ start:805 stop:1185 length:381 start_codon:yes stop_codon:yes gene_type:complete